MLLFKESEQLWTWKCINKPIRHIRAVLIQHFEHKCNSSLDQSKTVHMHCCKFRLGWIIHYGLSLAFQRWRYKKRQARWPCSWVNINFLNYNICLIQTVQDVTFNSFLTVSIFGVISCSTQPILRDELIDSGPWTSICSEKQINIE
jgi:hypothetical protein